MTHKLEHISITNFRSCRQVDIPLADFTPLVGYNNGGKSNILTAIKWLLQRSMLNGSHYYDELKPVIISGVVGGITDELLDLLGDKHKKHIEPYLSASRLHIRRIQNKPTDSAKNIR